jgi:hypothetical protein
MQTVALRRDQRERQLGDVSLCSRLSLSSLLLLLPTPVFLHSPLLLLPAAAAYLLALFLCFDRGHSGRAIPLALAPNKNWLLFQNLFTSSL